MTFAFRPALLSGTAPLRADLALDFTTGVLDSRITFSRPSNATYYDSTGKLTFAANNLLFASKDMTSGAWAKNAGSAAVVVGAAPDGTNATSFTPDTTNAIHRAQGNIGTAVAPGNGFVSFYLKSNGVRYVYVNCNASTGIQVAVDLQTGAFVTATGTNVTVVSAGNGWWQVSAKGVGATALQFFLQANTSLAATDQTYTGDGTSSFLYWQGSVARVTYETAPRPMDMVETIGFSSYFGPRFDYDPSTLAARGLLIEEARTNLFLYSGDFSNAAWSTFQSTKGSTALAPDGTTTALQLVGTAGTVAPQFYQSVTTAASSHTMSAYVKANTRSWVYFQYNGGTQPKVWFNLSSGTVGTVQTGSATIQSVGNGWYRCTWTFTAGGTFPFVIAMTNADAAVTYASSTADNILVWGAQVEPGAFATSYIPTANTPGGVNRSADTAKMEGTAFSSWYNQSAGTFILNGAIVGYPASGAPYSLGVDDGTASNFIGLLGVSGGFTANSSGLASTLPLGNPVPATLNFSVSLGLAANDVAGCINGGTVQTRNVYTPPTNLSALRLGNITAAGGFASNLWVRSLTYYRQRLSNAQLQLLTAPNLAAALALDIDFTTGVLDPRITFERLSGATFVDSTGRVTYAPNNLVTQSLSLSTWTFSNSSISALGDGFKLIEDTANNGHYTIFNGGGSGGNAFVFSADVEAAGRTMVVLYMDDTAGNRIAYSYNLVTGAMVSTASAASGWSNFGSGATQISGTRWRVWIYGTSTYAAIGARIALSNGTTNYSFGLPVYTGDGTSGVILRGVQLERVTYQTQPRAYIPTTTGAKYGPRFTYDPVSLQPLGLLIEESRQNLVVQSNNFAATWTNVTSMSLGTPGTFVDGTQTFSLLTATQQTANRYQQAITVTNGTTYTWSTYFKAGTANGYIRWDTATTRAQYKLNLSAGTAALFNSTGNASSVVVTSVGNGVWRVAMTIVADATTATLQVGPWDGSADQFGYPGSVAGASVYVGGAQLEAGSFATSYLPTTTGSLTRSADSASITGASFSSWFNAAQGTFVFQTIYPSASSSSYVLSQQSGQGLLYASGTLRNFNGARNLNSVSVSAGVSHKSAGSYNSSGSSITVDGNSISSDANQFFTTTPTTIWLLSNVASNGFMNGTISRAQFYNVRAADYQLQQLTQ